jgi:hypothetical protein
MSTMQDKLRTLRGALALLEAARGLRGVRMDDVLARVGLERQRSAPAQAAPWLSGFAAGFLAGGATGLLLAPMEGRALRERIRQEAGKLREAWLGYDQHADERPGGFDTSERQASTGG